MNTDLDHTRSHVNDFCWSYRYHALVGARTKDIMIDFIDQISGALCARLDRTRCHMITFAWDGHSSVCVKRKSIDDFRVYWFDPPTTPDGLPSCWTLCPIFGDCAGMPTDIARIADHIILGTTPWGFGRRILWFGMQIISACAIWASCLVTYDVVARSQHVHMAYRIAFLLILLPLVALLFDTAFGSRRFARWLIRRLS